MNKCIKIALKNCNEMDWKKAKSMLKDVQYKTYKACNRAMIYFYTFEQGNMELKEVFEEKIKDKDIFNLSLRGWIYHRMTEIMDNCLTANVSQAEQFVERRYKNDKKKGLLKGDVVISNFKRDIPIFLHARSYNIIKDDRGYEIEIGIFNKEYQKQNNIHKLSFNTDKLDNNKKSTLNKILDGEYTQRAASLCFDKKGKLYILISFSFDKEENYVLDKNRVLGVDLGITNIATLAIWDNTKGDWDSIKYSHNVLDGRELINYRQKLFNMGLSQVEIEKLIAQENKKRHEHSLKTFQERKINGTELNKIRNDVEKQRRALYISTKIASEGNIGHGYNTRVKRLNKLRDKIANFRDTMNHKYSKYIVDFAVRNNCGIIQIENLEGFDPNEKFLKSWAYYDLQSKIEYKAQEQGIDVIKVNPKYTSKRCSQCGCIHEANRNCKTNQAKFKCIICGHEENADINAAKNISIPYIDMIIEEQLKEKKKIS